MLETQIVATFEADVHNFLQEQSDHNLSSHLSAHFLLLSILEPGVKIILAFHCDPLSASSFRAHFAKPMKKDRVN